MEKVKTNIKKIIAAIMIIISIIVGILTVPTFHPSTPSVGELTTWYMRSDQHMVNGLTAYILNETQSSSSESVSDTHSSTSGYSDVYVAAKVFIRHSDGTETEISSAWQIRVERSSNGEGLQSDSWACPEEDLDGDAIVVKIYTSFDAVTYTLKATFISDTMNGTIKGTWNFYFYTKRSTSYTTNPKTGQTTYYTYVYFYWGDSSYNSHIEDVEFSPILYSNLGHSSNIHGSIVKFYCKWSLESGGLSGWIFSWNGTGAWTNSSWYEWSGNPTEGWSNITRRLDKNGTIQYKFYMNETDGSWHVTETMSFQTEEPNFTPEETLSCVEADVREETSWTTVGENLNFTLGAGSGFVSEDLNATFGNYIKIYNINSEYGTFINVFEVKFRTTSLEWLSPDLVENYSEDTDSDDAIDGDTSTCWAASAPAWIEVMFIVPHEFNGIEFYVDSANDRTKLKNVNVDIRFHYPENWTETGATPYLNASDYPNNYVSSNETSAATKEFKFENLTDVYVQQVKLAVNFSISDNTALLYIYYETDNTHGVLNLTADTADTWEVKNVTIPIETWSLDKLNSLKVFFIAETNDTYKIDEAYLVAEVKIPPSSLIEFLKRYSLKLDGYNINWSESIDTVYLGFIMGQKTLQDLNNSYNSLSDSDWKSVIAWSARLQKLGIENETKIKNALDNAEMLSNGDGLPKTGSDSDGDYFSNYWGELIFGYYFADKYNYAKSKWNITKAYNNFHSAWVNTGHGFLKYYSTTHTEASANRFYDECAETIRAFLLFYKFGVNDALQDAEDEWNYINNHLH